jgi:hypothetical protein
MDSLAVSLSVEEFKILVANIQPTLDQHPDATRVHLVITNIFEIEDGVWTTDPRDTLQQCA